MPWLRGNLQFDAIVRPAPCGSIRCRSPLFDDYRDAQKGHGAELRRFLGQQAHPRRLSSVGEQWLMDTIDIQVLDNPDGSISWLWESPDGVAFMGVSETEQGAFEAAIRAQDDWYRSVH